MINISQKILVGLHHFPNGGIPKAIISPVGKTSGEKNKIKSIMNTHSDSREFNNTALPGFTLTTCSRSSWAATETVWSVIDPRGFTSTITSDNLEKILHYTGITEGLIQEKCVWARENERISMILIPVNAPEYVEAQTNTQLILNKVSKKDINIGDKVLLQNKLTGQYCGQMTMFLSSKIDTKSMQILPEIYGKRQLLKYSTDVYYFQTDLKMLSVLSPIEQPMSKPEAQTLLLDDISAGARFTSHSGIVSLVSTTSSYGAVPVRYVASGSFTEKDISIVKEEVSLEEATILLDRALNAYDCGMVMLEDTSGISYLVDVPTSRYSKTSRNVNTNSFAVFEVSIVDGNLFFSRKHLVKSRLGNTNFSVPDTRHELTDFAKYYKLVKHVKNGQYI